MQENKFVIAKAHLLELLYFRLKNTPVSNTAHHEIITVIQIVNEYSYINRLQQKGRLARIIVDSLNLDYELGDLIIQFDQRIS